MWRRRENRRKTRVVLKEMQRRIMMQTAVFPMVALTIMTIAVTVLCKRLIDDAATTAATLGHLQRLLAAFLLLAPAIAGAILFVSFRFSHRIAGPTYRIVQSLKRIEDGELGFRIRLRRDDFLTEIAEQLNETLDALQAGSAAQEQQARAPEGSRSETEEAATPAAETLPASSES